MFVDTREIHKVCVEVFKHAEEARYHLFLAPGSLVTLTYVLRKLPFQRLVANLHYIRSVSQIIETGPDQIDLMLNNPGQDPEDAFQHACAVSIGAKYIITNDQAFIANSSINAFTPAAFLKVVGEIDGWYCLLQGR